MTLSELAPSELLALSALVDQCAAADGGGADPARWRSLVLADVARRFAAIEESTRIMEEARAARGG